MERPLTAHQLQHAINLKAAQMEGENITPEFRTEVLEKVEKVCNRAARQLFTMIVTGYWSGNEIPDSYIAALAYWLEDDQMAISEARLLFSKLWSEYA